MTEAEFEEFFLARGPALRRCAYVVLGDWHAADDVTQAALTKVYRAWSRIEPRSLEAYARRAVVNEAISAVRRPRREWPAATLPDVAGPVPGEGSALDLPGALARLAPQQRAVVALRFLDDLSVAEVARTLGIAEGTVKSQTSRALGILRAHLADLVLTEEP